MGLEKNVAQKSLFGGVQKSRLSSLRADYILPPFSVLSAREGEWQNRKRAWVDLGIDSELGRGDHLTKEEKESNVRENKLGKCLPDQSIGEKFGRKVQTTSIFDPVLCELLLSWFTNKGYKVLDPFAGGSVRGLVSGYLGREYDGIDLSNKQIEANIEQYNRFNANYGVQNVKWYCGDSNKMDDILPKDKKYDFILTCPPYADLEVYSNDPDDISNMTYDKFMETLTSIIKKACDKLEENRFAAIVVGELRDKKTGVYRGFVPDTINAFRACGMQYYDEMILVTSAGSLPIRVKRQFKVGRKIGKSHQNVLVFYKGDTSKIRDMGNIQ